MSNLPKKTFQEDNYDSRKTYGDQSERDNLRSIKPNATGSVAANSEVEMSSLVEDREQLMNRGQSVPLVRC